MDMPIAAHDIDYAEDLLAEGELETARVLLEELAAEAGEYADTACIATDARQWFSFASPFERLAYRRVERDPRELTQLGPRSTGCTRPSHTCTSKGRVRARAMRSSRRFAGTP